MIPKIIHYCWFGHGEKPELFYKCLESWKKYCPDYEIKEWNEDNYDITKNGYMYDAYQKQRWGFVPDYAREDIIYEYGGIYLDTDVELIRNLDDLLVQKGFIGMELEHKEYFINPGLGFGAEPHNEMIKSILDEYNNLHFIREDGSLNLKPSPFYVTDVLTRFGFKANNTLQEVNGFLLLPSDYLAPKNFETKEITLTNNTFSIHHFDCSWKTDEEKSIQDLYYFYLNNKHFKHKKAHRLSVFRTYIKTRGVLYTMRVVASWIKKDIKDLTKKN